MRIQKDKEKKKKKKKASIEAEIFRIVEKSLDVALKQAIDDLFKGFK